jgi:urease accessory protein
MAPELFIWLSPAFPVGAYAYSQGLEYAVEIGLVTDRQTLDAWIRDMFAHGAARTDLICLAASHRAVCAGAVASEINSINTLALALQPSAERYLETTQQGGSFLDAISDAWSNARYTSVRAGVAGPIAYPVAVGLVAASRGIERADTLSAFAIAQASNVTSAAIRLSVVGQTDAQRTLAELGPLLEDAARKAETASLDQIATATWSADLASLEHETQYTRLFRS